MAADSHIRMISTHLSRSSRMGENKLRTARDAFFDQDARPFSDRAESLVEQVLFLLFWFEEEHSLRARKRKEKDQGVLDEQVAAILANVCLAHLRPAPRKVAVPLSKRVLTAKGAPAI